MRTRRGRPVPPDLPQAYPVAALNQVGPPPGYDAATDGATRLAWGPGRGVEGRGGPGPGPPALPAKPEPGLGCSLQLLPAPGGSRALRGCSQRPPPRRPFKLARISKGRRGAARRGAARRRTSVAAAASQVRWSRCARPGQRAGTAEPRGRAEDLRAAPPRRAGKAGPGRPCGGGGPQPPAGRRGDSEWAVGPTRSWDGAKNPCQSRVTVTGVRAGSRGIAP